jgi:ribosomal protein S18 acetylase RimI-like enzyme
MVPLVTDIIVRLECSYDAIPREAGARVERVGPFELFVREGAGWPFYARPHLGAENVSLTEVQTVRARQRELGAPEAIEWVHDVTPSLLLAARSSGLSVLMAPLMVLNTEKLPAVAALTDVTVFLLDPDSSDFAELSAVSTAAANVGFGAGGTHIGPAGPTERDAAVAVREPALVDALAASLRSGRTAEAVAITPSEGIVARGVTQRGAGAVEVAGVATLPSARRRGLGAAVSALLARHALDNGADLVFLTAASEEVARIYRRVGFERVGTACVAEVDSDL